MCKIALAMLALTATLVVGYVVYLQNTITPTLPIMDSMFI